MSQFELLPFTAKAVHNATIRDRVFSQAYDAVARGGNSNSEEELDPYYSRRNELSPLQGYLIWGIQVVIPPTLRRGVRQELHTVHLGMGHHENIPI